jgi:hypothetical protein
VSAERTFRDNVWVPSSRIKKSKRSRKPVRETRGLCRERSGRRQLSERGTPVEDGTDTLARNVGKGLPLDAALYPRTAQMSSVSRRKPEITETMATAPKMYYRLNRIQEHCKPFSSRVCHVQTSRQISSLVQLHVYYVLQVALVLRFFDSTPLVNLHHFLLCLASFSVNALWLAAFFYADPHLFRYFVWEYNFLITPSLFTPTFSGTRPNQGFGECFYRVLHIAISICPEASYLKCWIT